MTGLCHHARFYTVLGLNPGCMLGPHCQLSYILAQRGYFRCEKKIPGNKVEAGSTVSQVVAKDALDRGSKS